MTAAHSRSAKPRRLSFRWTLTRKIYAVGFFSMLALASLSGASLLTTTWIVDATGQSEERHADILVAKDMLIKQLNVDIAVGDILFNSVSAKINPKVLDQINLDIMHLNKTSARLATAATTEEQRRLASSIGEQNDALALAIQVDLPLAVEMGGDRKELERVDALIKEKVAALRRDLGNLETLFQKEAAKAGEDARHTADVSRVGSGIAFLVVTTVLMIIQVVLGRSIAKPITAMTRSMLRLAGGDKTAEIPAVGRKDEVGEMANAVQVFKEGMIEADRLAEEQRREQEERAARTKRIEALCQAFDATSTEAVKSVATAATEMQSSSEAMSATAEETTRQASAVAAASEQASANVETVASAAEELSSSIAEIGRQVTQASQIASAAVTEAEQTNIKVQGLAQAANKIGEVVALITDIAEQTNLLALNATIEAARAGDAGKGFAVVASEVKNLANQTAKATDEIGAQIAGIQAATQEAVSAIESITKTISKINEVNSGVASAVEEQGAATQEIARNVEQAAAGTHEVSSNIAGVSQAATETGSAASEIHSAAGELSQQSEKLRNEVDKFLAGVRAA